TGREQVTLPACFPLAFSPDGTVLATGRQDTSGVRLWNVLTQEAQCDLEEAPSNHGPPRPVCSLSLCFAPDGKTLVTVDIDALARVWDVEQRRLRATLRGHQELVAAVAFSADGRILATGSRDRTIVLWDTQTWQPQATLQGHTGAIHCVAFSPD